MSEGAEHGMAAEPLAHARRRSPGLLCRFGRHRPAHEARWNDGFYFSRCRGCGRDIVRTAFEGWHVPRGFRVVWQERPPADSRIAALVHAEEPAAIGDEQPADDNQMELPISQVLRSLDEPEPEPEPEPAPAPPADEPPPAPPSPPPPPAAKGRVWDFMEEEGVAGPTAPTQPAPAGRDEQPEMLELTVTASARTHSGAEWTSIATSPGAPPPPERRSRLGGLSALLLLGVGLLLVGATVLAALVERPAAPAPAPAPSPVTVLAPAVVPTSTPAMQARPAPAVPASYVAASLLNCRSAPDYGAPIVRTMSRGEAVRAIGRDGDWASLAVDGRQCWALARYVTDVRPL